jgi:hypothetical protein
VEGDAALGEFGVGVQLHYGADHGAAGVLVGFLAQFGERLAP